jgi:hypothetical protein
LPSSSLQNNQGIKAPDIAFHAEKAFFPLRVDPFDNKIKPSFQTRVCAKELIGICLKWELRTVFFDQLEWFYMNEFGLYKLPSIK